MSKSNFKLYFILLAIGFIFICLDVDVRTNFSYPKKYANTNAVTGEFQYYNISSLYGATCNYKLIDTTSSNNSEQTNIAEQATNAQTATETKVIDKVFFDNIHIDIFNDFIGLILILIACMKLGIVNRRFRFGALSAFCGIILHMLISLLPFMVNGLLLCNISMIMGISYLACNLLTSFLFTNGLFKMCPQVCCRDERKWGKMTWFVSFTLQILITFIFWLGSDFRALYTLGIIFETILIIDIIGFWMIMRRTLPYLEKTYHHSLEKTHS